MESLEARVQQMEKKLASVGAMDQALDQFSKQEQKLNPDQRKIRSLQIDRYNPNRSNYKRIRCVTPEIISDLGSEANRLRNR